VELRDSELSSGSVRVEVVRHAASQQSLQDVLVSRVSDNAQQDDVFKLRITVCLSVCLSVRRSGGFVICYLDRYLDKLIYTAPINSKESLSAYVHVLPVLLMTLCLSIYATGQMRCKTASKASTQSNLPRGSTDSTPGRILKLTQ